MTNFEENVLQRLTHLESSLKLSERIGHLETDVAYIRGELSGRNHKDEKKHSRLVLFLSIGAFVVAVASVFIRMVK